MGAKARHGLPPHLRLRLSIKLVVLFSVQVFISDEDLSRGISERCQVQLYGRSVHEISERGRLDGQHPIFIVSPAGYGPVHIEIRVFLALQAKRCMVCQAVARRLFLFNRSGDGDRLVSGSITVIVDVESLSVDDASTPLAELVRDVSDSYLASRRKRFGVLGKRLQMAAHLRSAAVGDDLV